MEIADGAPSIIIIASGTLLVRPEALPERHVAQIDRIRFAESQQLRAQVVQPDVHLAV